jgi:hypothetical protein
MDDQQLNQLISALEKVSKESTLATFVKSFPGLGDKIANQVGKGTKDANKNLDNAAKGFKGIGKDIKGGETSLTKILFNSSKNLASGTAGLKDATNIAAGALSKIPMAGKLAQFGLTSIGEYVENSVTTFRNLSTVGAGLNGELVNFRQLAAASRLSLDDFASIVKNNTESLAAFAGGVEGGTRNFARLSKDMFETGNAQGSYADQLYKLGYSFEDMNELLVENTNLSRIRNLEDGETRKKALESALGLAKQMDIVAKLTGKDAKAAKDDLTARLRNGATQAKIRLLEKDGVKGAADAYKGAQTALKAAPKVVQDLMDDLIQTGVPMTEATKNFAATNKEAYALAQKAAAATKAGDIEAAQKYAEQAAAATAKQADSRQGLYIATLQQVSGVAATQASVLEQTGPLIDNMRQYAEKQGKVLGESATYAETFRDMLKEMTTVQGEQIKAVKGAGDPLLSVAAETEKLVRNSQSAVQSEIAKIFTESGTIGQGLNEFANILTGINDPKQINAVVEQLMRFATANDLDSKTLQAYLENPKVYGVGEEQAKILKEMLPQVQQAEEVLKDPASTTQQRNEAQAVLTASRVIIEDIDAAAMTKLGKVPPLVSPETALESERLKSLGEQGNKGAQDQTEIRERGTFDVIKGLFNSDDESKPESNEEPNPRDGGSLKATGRLIENFGDGTPLTGHGNEGVITAQQLENMAMGVSNIIKSVSPNTGASASINPEIFTNVAAKFEQVAQQLSQNNKATSQSADNDPFDKLNSTIEMLAASSSKHLDVAKKQLKTQKGLGGDIFKGFGLG